MKDREVRTQAGRLRRLSRAIRSGRYQVDERLLVIRLLEVCGTKYEAGARVGPKVCPRETAERHARPASDRTKTKLREALTPSDGAA